VPLWAHPTRDDPSTATSPPKQREPPWKFNESFSFTVLCDSQAEVDWYWDKLVADGGKEKDCCWCEDRFGVSWQIVPRLLVKCNEAGGEKAKKATAEMMTWKKADVARLEKAIC
jgi:predicted 3-demethylubiquinone-9 3-methyltransferase (glyoxalase superfamily)